MCFKAICSNRYRHFKLALAVCCTSEAFERSCLSKENVDDRRHCCWLQHVGT